MTDTSMKNLNHPRITNSAFSQCMATVVDFHQAFPPGYANKTGNGIYHAIFKFGEFGSATNSSLAIGKLADKSGFGSSQKGSHSKGESCYSAAKLPIP
jgi:hypothetical protein